MHHLTELICDKFKSFTMREVDKIITTYLKSRAEWLKEQWMKDVDFTIELIDTAFELDEKCEHYCACGEKLQDNGKCPLEPRDEPKPLPSKFMSSDHFDLMDVACKLGDLIDYLHSKEAREGV